jgi:peptidyl-prolyl cis-trans isomerase D
MLDSLRKKQHKFLYSMLLFATIAVMAFFGVNKMSQDGSGGGAAAWVNGEPIPAREFVQELEYRKDQYRNMLGAQYDEKLLETFQVPQRTLEEMVQYKLLAQQAHKLDFRVPDNELVDHIKAIPYFQRDGKFDAALYSKLPNRGLEERRQRERLLLTRMQSYLVDRVKLTPQELRDAYRLKETKVDVDYAKIDFNELANQQKPSATAVAEFLKKTAESEIKGYYDSHRSDFLDKSAVDLRQIRVGVPFQAKADVKAAAKKKIEAIAKEVNAKNFGEVAKKQSDDEYAKNGGKVGWVSKGTLEAPLEQAIEKLGVNQVSQPIETSFGYYLLLVDGKRQEKAKAFADVKSQIAETLLLEKNKREFTDHTKAALEKQLAEGKPLDAELKKYKIEVKKTGPFSLGQGFIPNVGQAETLADAIAELTKENPLPKKLAFHQGNYYYLKLRSVEAPKAAEFAKTSETLDKTLATQVESALLGKWMETLRKNSTINVEAQFQSKAPAIPGTERS